MACTNYQGISPTSVIWRVVLRILQYRLYICCHHLTICHPKQQERCSHCFCGGCQLHGLEQQRFCFPLWFSQVPQSLFSSYSVSPGSWRTMMQLLTLPKRSKTPLSRHLLQSAPLSEQLMCLDGYWISSFASQWDPGRIYWWVPQGYLLHNCSTMSSGRRVELLSWFSRRLFVTSLGPLRSKLRLVHCLPLREVSCLLELLIVDEMLPFSKYMHHISPFTGTPIIAVWVNVIFCALLGLIDLASYTAISAIFNVLFLASYISWQVCAIAMDWSYCIPILCKVSPLISTFTLDILARQLYPWSD